MATAVRISENLLTDAIKYSKVDHRSITEQIEHWARIGKCVEENPDLTYVLIKEMIIGVHELDQGEKTEYNFGVTIHGNLPIEIIRPKSQKIKQSRKTNIR